MNRWAIIVAISAASACKRDLAASVGDSVQADYPRIRATCYEGALATNPKLSGTVFVRVAIARDGHVQSAEQATDIHEAFPNAAVAKCVADEVTKMKFQETERDDLQLDIPFLFTPRVAGAGPG
jgi:hypothetical protein